MFVLATTDPQKVPPTIRSRTQHLEFRLLGAETLHGLLESVNADAGLNLDEEALEAAVRRGRGSARDALSALDQVAAAGSADVARPELAEVLNALAEGDVSQVLVALNTLLAGGWGPQQLATELIDDLRQVFLAALAPELSRGLRIVVGALPFPGRDHGPGPGRAQHGDPRAMRWSTCARRPTRRWCSRSQSCEPSGPTSTRAWRPCPNGSASWSALVREPPPSPVPVGRRSRGGCGPSRRRTGTLRAGATGVRAPRPATSAGAPPSALCAGASRRQVPRGGDAPAPPAAEPPPLAAPRSDARPRRPPRRRARSTVTASPRPGATGSSGRSRPRAKALYSAGRFVAVDDDGAHFRAARTPPTGIAVPSWFPRSRRRSSAHFGTPVTLVLDVDDAAPAAGSPQGRPAASGGEAAVVASGRGRDAEAEEVDPAEFLDHAPDAGTDQESAAEARLLEAFPGASEVAG